MDSKTQDFKLSPSMRSNHGNSERPEPSAPKKMKSLTLFEDVLDNPDTGANLEPNGDEDSSRPFNSQNEANATNECRSWLSIGFNTISDDNMVYQGIKKYLVSSPNSGGFDAQVETIYRNGHSSTTGRAKLQSFRIYSRAVAEKCGGNANMNSAWCGASKNEITAILSHGFGLPVKKGIYGNGFYFSAARYPVESLQSSTADADGLRHMLLCRVILGKTEVITPGSEQYNPSSEEFDSAVDSLVYPKKYIFWNAKVNTHHVLPEFVISFRISS